MNKLKEKWLNSKTDTPPDTPNPYYETILSKTMPIFDKIVRFEV
ncbi:hypothetical protein ACW9HJ_35265 [Nocardia gipuzkoensis]